MISKTKLQEQSRLNNVNLDQFLNEEFQLEDSDVNQIKSQISSSIRDIIHSHSKPQSLSPLRRSDQQTFIKPVNSRLSVMQIDEIENYQALSYLQYPVQPCVKSLYHISKIAQLQQINIMFPPTVLIMMNGDNRFVHNCPLDGHMIVESSIPMNEQSLKKFIKRQMNSILDQYPIESKLLLPRYVIRIAQNESRKNDIKVYYSLDALISDALVFWENCDMAIQLFIRQKGIRPKMYRYIMKNGNTIKSFQICNQNNLDTESVIIKTVDQLVKSQQQPAVNQKQEIETQTFFDNLYSLRLRESISVTSQGFLKQQQALNSTKSSKFKQNELTKDKSVLPQGILPKTLEGFKLPVYFNDMQVIIPNKKIKKAFCCTSDNIKNLSMTQFRPSAMAKAEKMTQDLSRLFNQYYLKSNKYGNIKKFVCDFIEDDNGQIYLLHIKSFECEGVLEEWQQKWNPSSTLNTADGWLIKKKDLIDDFELQFKQCQLKILCTNAAFTKSFVKCCKDEDAWKFNLKKLNTLPFVSSKIKKRYRQDYEASQFEWTENKHRSSVCPLIPLIYFKEKVKEVTSLSPKRRQTIAYPKQSNQFIQFVPTSIEEKLKSRQSIAMKSKPVLTMNQTELPQIYEDLPCCFPCYKVLELYSQRNEAMIFKSDQEQEELKELKHCLIQQWDEKKIKFVLSQYKKAKTLQNRVPSLEKMQRINKRRNLLSRSKTPNQQISEQASQNITQKMKLDNIKNTKYNQQEIGESEEQKNKFIKKQLRHAKKSSEEQKDLPNLLTPYQKQQFNKNANQQQTNEFESILQMSQSASILDFQQKQIIKSKSNRNIKKENVVQRAKEQIKSMEFLDKQELSKLQNTSRNRAVAASNQHSIKMKQNLNNKELGKLVDQFGLKLDQASKTLIEKDMSRNPMTQRPTQNPYLKSQLKSFINLTQQNQINQEQTLFNVSSKQQGNVIVQDQHTMGSRKISQKSLHDLKLQEFSMYFNNKREIQNSKVKLTYRNLEQLKSSRTTESNSQQFQQIFSKETDS